jgi:hypothetical protein
VSFGHRCIPEREGVMSPSVPANEFVRPAVQWSGTIPDAGKEKMKPKSGVITGWEPFAELWAAWELGKEAPHVDFDSYFVVVEVGPYAINLVHLMVDGEGRGRAVFKDGPEPERQGFGYGIGVFPRAGIKTYRGVVVAKREES